MSLNKFIGIGRNTKDGELRTSESGISVYKNSIAITNDFKNKNGEYDSEFINYVAYRNTADYLNKYSQKGTLIHIEGRVHTSKYEKDGKTQYSTEIVVESASSYKTNEKTTDDNTIKEDAQEEVLEDIPPVKSNYEGGDVQLSDNDLPF